MGRTSYDARSSFNKISEKSLRMKLLLSLFLAMVNISLQTQLYKKSWINVGDHRFILNDGKTVIRQDLQL